VLPKSLAVTRIFFFMVYLRHYFNCSTLFVDLNPTSRKCIMHVFVLWMKPRRRGGSFFMQATITILRSCQVHVHVASRLSNFVTNLSALL
jgi:hypothetical protein